MTIIDSQVHAYEANSPKRPWHSVPNWPDHVTGSMLPAATSCSSGFHRCARERSIKVASAFLRLASLSPMRVTSSSPAAPPPATMTWWSEVLGSAADLRASAVSEALCNAGSWDTILAWPAAPALSRIQSDSPAIPMCR